MKIKEGFILREIAGNYIVVAIGDRVKDFNAVINLNESGAFLWKKLSEGASKEELIESLTGEYDVDKETAEKDIDAFIEKVREAGLTD